MLTIEQYLRGKIDFEIPESTMLSVLLDRGVEEETLATEASEMQRDLCLADLLMWCADSATVSSGESESDGGWSRKKATKNVTDRYGMRSRALSLYKKWGIDCDDISGTELTDLY